MQQDKEFDELFKNRFEDAEVEPSSNLWNNIEEKLVVKVKRKRIFPVYWGAAAAITAAVTVGLLFQKTEKTSDIVAVQKPVIVNKDKPAVAPVQSVLAENDPKAIQDNATPGNTVPDNTVVNNVEERGTALAANLPKLASEKQMEYQSALASRVNTAAPGTDITGTDHKTILTVAATEKKDLLAMQPSPVISHLNYKELQLKREVIKLPKAIAVKPVEEVMLASADVPAAAKDEETLSENKQESKGIRNVGDLINYVVDKVDKREEKFIQFNRDDDDNSSSIALNIGMFRISPKKHK